MANQENFIVNMGKIFALCISNKKGIQKHEIPEALFLENFGIEGDAHAGNWHRQVSFLDEEEINAFKEKGAEITNGAFGENVIIQGIKINELAVGQWLKCGDVIFEITQTGKECHEPPEHPFDQCPFLILFRPCSKKACCTANQR